MERLIKSVCLTVFEGLIAEKYHELVWDTRDAGFSQVLF